MMKFRLAILSAVVLLVSAGMVCVAWPVAPAQAQDPTLLYLDSERTRRQGELAATQAAIRAAQLTRQAEQQATAFAVSVRQTEDAHQAAATATARAGEIKAAQATETAVAGQTATTQARAAQAAASTATAAAAQTADAIAYQATVDANRVQSRQQLIAQSRQAVRIGGAFVLIMVGAGFCGLMWRYVIKPQPEPVVIVEEATPAREPEPPMDGGEGADITNDPRASAYIIDLLRQKP